MTTAPNPYIGPRPFERKDSPRFFGRDQEARALFSLIVASRVVVLYAPSGAGKTSLLNAQIAPLLEAEKFELWPFARVQGPALKTIAPDSINNIYAFYALFSWSGDEADLTAHCQKSITDYLADYPHLTDESGYEQPRVLIFDQLEELFTAYPARWPEREAFLAQIAQALDNDPLLRVVFSLREDYVAQLDPYAYLLPRNLSTRFRLERMQPGAALTAVRSPLRETERNFAPGVAEKLVEDLRSTRVETAVGEVQIITGEFVEPVQLQVVCQNLWEELPAEVMTITEEHLQTFGNVNQALARFYERAVSRALPLAGVDEATLRSWFETALITPAGTRGTVYRGLQQSEGVANEAVDSLEDMHLIRGEFRAGSRWYELTHDRLVTPILQANRAWQEARQQARIKRIRQVGITAVALLALVALLAFLLLFLQRQFTPVGSMTLQQTATSQAAYVAEFQATATVAVAVATAQAEDAAVFGTGVAETAVAQVPANETATAAIATATSEAIIRETAVVEAAFIQQTQEAALAALAVEASVTAVARATTDAQATRTSAELDRLRVPVRPLQPGISIGNQNSVTAGTLSAFVVDDEGTFYLLGPNFALGAADAPILQPSPIDGGQPDNAVAFTSRRMPLVGLGTIDAALFINLAQLEPGIAFQTTIPGIGPILGEREPMPGEEVWVYGRTSGLVESSIITCDGGCQVDLGGGDQAVADFALEKPLSLGDEGALVVGQDGYAVGIVAVNGPDYSLVAEMTAVLDQFDVAITTVGQQYTEFQAHDGLALSVTFSPDGHLLATAGQDRVIRLWEMQYPFTVTELSGHADTIYAISFNPNGQWLASAGRDLSIRLWPIDTENDQPIVLEDSGHKGRIWDIEFSPNDLMLATASEDGSVRLWRFSNRNLEPIVLAGHENSVFSVAFSPDGRLLASASGDRTVRLWDITTAEPTLVTTLQHNIGVNSVAFSPYGDVLATTGVDGKIFLWNIVGFVTSQTVISESEPFVLFDTGVTILSLVFSPDGNTLAAGTVDGLLFQWNVQNLNEAPLVIDVGKQVMGAAYNPTNNWLATSLDDGRVVIWLVR